VGEDHLHESQEGDQEKKVEVTFDGDEVSADSLVPFFGLGSYTHASNEMCLLGTSCSGGRAKGFVSCCLHRWENTAAKPGRRIVEFFGGPKKTSKIELFARERVEGWDAWGLEVD